MAFKDQCTTCTAIEEVYSNDPTLSPRPFAQPRYFHHRSLVIIPKGAPYIDLSPAQTSDYGHALALPPIPTSISMITWSFITTPLFPLPLYTTHTSPSQLLTPFFQNRRSYSMVSLSPRRILHRRCSSLVRWSLRQQRQRRSRRNPSQTHQACPSLQRARARTGSCREYKSKRRGRGGRREDGTGDEQCGEEQSGKRWEEDGGQHLVVL